MDIPEQWRILGAPASRRRVLGIFHPKRLTAKQKRGLTLIELLCVIAIIAILAAMYLGALSKGFLHVKKMLGS